MENNSNVKAIEQGQLDPAGFWKDYSWLVILFFVALSCDGASTIYFMLRDGTVEGEVHPAINIVSRILGPVGGPIFAVAAKFTVGIIVAMYCRRFAFWILLVPTVLSVTAACYNLWGSPLEMPGWLEWLPWK